VTKKLVSFDFDGVLVTGTNKGYIKCYIAAMKEAGAIEKKDEKRATEQIIKHWGSDYITEITSVVKDPKKIEQTKETYLNLIQSDLFLKHVKKAPYVNSALDLVSKNGFTPTVISGSPKDHIERIMLRVGINPGIFKELRSGCNYPKKFQKPHPRMLNDQMKKFRFAPQNTIYIGDAKADIKMANSAKVTSVTVLTGTLNRKNAIELKSDFIINSLKEIKEVLECT